MKPSRFESFRTPIEIAVVFAVFYVFGSWPIPDSNEPYYIAKAIHFWQPDWIVGDSFLKTKDSHWTFYVVFGWLGFFFSPTGMAWIGRLITWGLLAWSWRRLSFALIPVRWMSIPTALALAYYVDAFHMAGEWILGGVEGKSFAFPFVFFGLEALVRGRWHRVWIFLGLASAFHVLVGGWSVLVAGFVWFLTDSKSIDLRESLLKRVPDVSPKMSSLLPWGLFVGGAISLFGLFPALLLDFGSPREIVREAHRIYVFERIYHHLVPYMLPWTYLARFFLLTAFWAIFCRFGKSGGREHRRFELFVWGTLLLSLIGLIAAYGLRENRELAAEILRFYWFRLSDVAVPMGVALGALWRFLACLRRLREESPEKIPPRFSEGLVMLGLPFGLYLAVDHLLFGRWFFSWSVRPEQGIPWLITLILCGFVLKLLFVVRKRDAAQTQAKIPATLICRGFLALYAAILFYAPFEALTSLGDVRTRFAYSRSEPGQALTAYHWIDACRWIAEEENTPKHAKFWVPRESATFKWHARRSDVGIWKDIPQDAEGIVAWFRTMRDLFSYVDEAGQLRWDRSLTVLIWWKTDEELERLRTEYGFDYILCGKYPELPHLESLETVYENELYRVYRVR